MSRPTPIFSIGGKTIDIDRLIDESQEEQNAETRFYHASIVSASSAKSTSGKEPTAVSVGALILLSFTINTDEAFRQFKIPASYVSDPSFHVHWTKTSNANEVGKVVKWKIEYVVFPSSLTESGNGAASPNVITFDDDTYESSSIAEDSRIIYRLPNYSLEGVVAGYYLSLRITAITPDGTPMASEPGLFSVDLMFRETF